MVKVGLLVKVHAKSGKEQELEDLLRGGLSLVQAESATITWYAFRIGAATFGIFDTFESEDGRNAHLAGKLAAALIAKAGELLDQPPVIEKIDILAAK